MAYSEDLRDRVRRYIVKGGSITEAIELFDVSRTSIYRWRIDQALEKSRAVLDLINWMKPRYWQMSGNSPDKLLKERADTFGMSVNGIWVTLKRLGVKKKTKIR